MIPDYYYLSGAFFGYCAIVVAVCTRYPGEFRICTSLSRDFLSCWRKKENLREREQESC